MGIRMEIEQVLRTENIDLNMQGTAKEEVLHKLSQMMQKNHEIEDAENFEQCVLERETLGFTGAGNFVAIPHGISSQIKQIVIAMARVPEAIYWDTTQDNIPEEAKKVRFIILFGVPENTEEEQDIKYIRVLQQICSKLIDKESVRFLMEAEKNEEIIEFFK